MTLVPLYPERMITEAAISEAEKRDALDAAVSSNTFARSAQLRAFLRYICEREMAGHLEDLTEYQIAVNVLGRGADFNLTDDSSVRNRVYELRQRLEKFYTTERPHPPIRIQIPRGGYVPYYTRTQPTILSEPVRDVPAERALAATTVSRTLGLWLVVGIALACLITGAIFGLVLARPHPPSILKEAWGPLAEPEDNMLISIATNMHMIVRPHIPEHPLRLPAPDEVYSIYGTTRPLPPGTPLFMEPAQLSVPLAELVATTALCSMRRAFGGSYQILPESEAPIPALRGRNCVLIGSGTNSTAASVLLRNLPLSIDYTKAGTFAVIDQRKPAGQNELFGSQPRGDPVASVLYGLLTVITTVDSVGKPKRTLVVSGAGSAGVQAAVEFFCSPLHMRELKNRFASAGLPGFPPTYQVVVRCKTVGIRLMSYEYASHVVVPKNPY